MFKVAVKCVNLEQTHNSEGILRGQFWQWGMKARGAKRIRYPCSPSSKHCTLNISTSSGGISAEGKPRVCYLGSIVARLKLKGIGGETLQQVTRAVQLDSTPWTSPGPTSRMKVSLKGLPDTLRGVAWPTSACAVRWPVKSGNRQDPHTYLQWTICRLPW
jgi:hypothetical protein